MSPQRDVAPQERLGRAVWSRPTTWTSIGRRWSARKNRASAHRAAGRLSERAALPEAAGGGSGAARRGASLEDHVAARAPRQADAKPHRGGSRAVPPDSTPCNLAAGRKECTFIDADPYITPTAKPSVARAVAQLSAVAASLAGAQSGGTTLLRRAFAGTLAYASLEAAGVRASAMEGPAAFSVCARRRWRSMTREEGGAIRR